MKQLQKARERQASFLTLPGAMLMARKCFAWRTVPPMFSASVMNSFNVRMLS